MKNRFTWRVGLHHVYLVLYLSFCYSLANNFLEDDKTSNVPVATPASLAIEISKKMKSYIMLAITKTARGSQNVFVN